MAACLLLASPPAGAADTIRDPAPGSPEAAIARALRAALASDFQGYLEVIHPAYKGSVEQRDQRKGGEWKRLQESARAYLLSEAPLTFAVARRTVDAEGWVRIFLVDQRHEARPPAPVRLARDGDAWKIVTLSL